MEPTKPMPPTEPLSPLPPLAPLTALTPTTERRAELASRAWTEALTLAGPHPGPAPATPPGGPRPPSGELVAAALRAHSALAAGLGRTIPVTGLEPGALGIRGLATFLAVYAGHHQRQDTRDLGTAA